MVIPIILVVALDRVVFQTQEVQVAQEVLALLLLLLLVLLVQVAQGILCSTLI